MVGGDLPIPGAGETSFGGWKGSIFRNHFVRGMEGKQFVTRFKSVAALWSSGITLGAVFSFYASRNAGHLVGWFRRAEI